MSISQLSIAMSKTNRAIIKSFENMSEKYFTENDIVCAYYEEFKKQLSTIGFSTDCDDVEGKKHQIIHTEYPTPFRCDMKNGFKRILDSDPDKKKYHRGHYDLVVVNPGFIGRYKYREIHAQDIRDQENIDKNRLISKVPPQLLFAMEFMYKREPFKASRGKNRYKAVDAYFQDIKQDYDKLAEGCTTGHIDDFWMLVFIKSRDDVYIQKLKSDSSKMSLNKLTIVHIP